MTYRCTLLSLLPLSLLLTSSVSAQQADEGPEVIEVEVEGGEDQYEYEYDYEVPEAPVYEITTPQYEQPPYYGQRQHRPRRYRVPYHQGMEIPPGGQVIKRRRMGLAIPGAVLFALPYLTTVAIWTSDPIYTSRSRVSGTVHIPAFGPFIALAQLNNDDYSYTGALKTGLAWSGVMQLVGITMMSFGFIGKPYLVYYADVNDRKVAFQVLPIASHDGAGAALNLTF
jgi:hypothetical protein